jgi:hypothetical protein
MRDEARRIAANVAKLPFPVHPHMVRHSTDTNSQTMGTILDSLPTTWGIAICNQRRDIPRGRKEGSRNSGKTDAKRARRGVTTTGTLRSSDHGYGKKSRSFCQLILGNNQSLSSSFLTSVNNSGGKSLGTS